MKILPASKNLSLFYKDRMQTFAFARFLTIINTWYFFIGVLSLCILCYFFCDIKIALWMNEHITGKLFHIIEKITNIAEGTQYYIGFLLLFFIFKILNKESLANICLFIFLSLLLTGVLCESLKITLGRCRPDLYINNHAYGLKFFELQAPMQSFPSGHTVNITALMIALSFLFPRRWLGFCVVFILLSLSRVALNQHYMSDVIFGMYLSIVTVTYLYKKLSGRLIPKVLKL